MNKTERSLANPCLPRIDRLWDISINKRVIAINFWPCEKLTSLEYLRARYWRKRLLLKHAVVVLRGREGEWVNETTLTAKSMWSRLSMALGEEDLTSSSRWYFCQRYMLSFHYIATAPNQVLLFPVWATIVTGRLYEIIFFVPSPFHIIASGPATTCSTATIVKKPIPHQRSP